jgi:Rrf2 family protein
MITISTRIRYATRTLVDISMHYQGEPIPLYEISERQGISTKYLETIMPTLKSAGLIESTKGPHGGYLPARPLNEITLFDVVAAFDGPVSLVKCVGGSADCERQRACAARDVWGEISDRINTAFKSVTIQHIADRQREKEEQERALVYYI